MRGLMAVAVSRIPVDCIRSSPSKIESSYSRRWSVFSPVRSIPDDRSLLFRLRDCFAGGCHNVIRCKAELFQQVFDRRRSSEPLHSDCNAGGTEITRPPKRGRLFHPNSRSHFRPENLVSVSLLLLFKNAPRRHADDTRLDAFRLELLIGVYAQWNFAPTRHQDHLRLVIGRVRENIRAPGDS